MSWIRTGIGLALMMLGVLGALSAGLEYSVFHTITKVEALYVWGLSLFLLVGAAVLVLDGEKRR